MPPKGDLWDWIEAGGTREQLKNIVENTSLLRQLRNDTVNAERLILKFGDRLRYCPAFRKWLVWDYQRWAVDDNNGYYTHDDGTDDQCAGIGAASVTITIRNHSKVPAGVSVNVETPLAKSIAFRSGWSV